MKGWPFAATGQRDLRPRAAPRRPLGLPANGTGQSRERGLAAPRCPAWLRCLRRQAAGGSGSAAGCRWSAIREPAGGEIEILPPPPRPGPHPETLPTLPYSREKGAKS